MRIGANLPHDLWKEMDDPLEYASVYGIELVGRPPFLSPRIRS
jgi:hypothetical protein